MKKILAIFLAAFMVVSLLPTVAFAETKTTQVSTWEALQTAINGAEEGDTIQLGEDISASGGDSTITIGKKLTLDLNGYMLNANGAVSYIESVITLQDGADLTIMDSKPTEGENEIWFDCSLGYWTTFKPDTYDDDDPVNRYTTITGGLITGTFGCAGVYVGGGAKCTLESGTIAGNVAWYDGGGVYVDERGAFEMNGGTISYNEANCFGGGVAVGSRSYSIDFGEFILNGGTISNNRAWSGGGGVYVSACPEENEGPYFTMTGGTISDNETNCYGGGVALEDCDAYTYNNKIHAIIMKMTGGTITKNYCYTFGGGVFFDGMYEYGSVMLGGTAVISGNWYGDPLNPQSDDYNDNLYIGDGKVDDSIGYIKFDESAAPASGMHVGVTLATGTGDLTATLGSIPEGITGYLYSDGTEYMVATDSNKVVLTNNIYPILYLNLNDGTDAHWGCEFGENNVPLTNPTRENYEFDGWYTAETDGKLEQDEFVAKTPYYAHWKEAPAVIIGDADGNKRLEANDITELINELLNGTECTEVLDCNGDGVFDILDLVRLKKYFATGTPLGKTE